MGDTIEQEAVISTSSDGSDGQGPKARWRLAGGWADRLEVIVPVLVYLVMVLTGMTTSSLGLLLEDPTQPPDDQIGKSLPIRSDEWLTATPIELATLANGSAMT